MEAWKYSLKLNQARQTDVHVRKTSYDAMFNRKLDKSWLKVVALRLQLVKNRLLVGCKLEQLITTYFGRRHRRRR